MLKNERKDAIVKIVNESGTATVNEIAELLNVSEMTVRRDLTDLSREGHLQRVHGGAQSVNGRVITTLSHEFTHAEKAKLHAHEKKQIATAALQYIEKGQTIFLGPGTTVATLASLLPNIELRVITNSFPVVDILSQSANIEVLSLGGLLRHSTSAFVGPIAEQSIENLGIDIAFISSNGVYEHSVSTSTASEGTLQKKVLDRANTRFLLCDSSKIEKRDFYTFCDLRDIDTFICDSKITDEEKNEIKQYTNLIIS